MGAPPTFSCLIETPGTYHLIQYQRILSLVVMWGPSSGPSRGSSRGGLSTRHQAVDKFNFLDSLHLLSSFWSDCGDMGPNGDNCNKQAMWQINCLIRLKPTRRRLGSREFFLFNFLPPSHSFPVPRITAPKGVQLALNVHLWLATFL